MEVFAVVKKGVYRHEICGIFEDVACAQLCAMKESMKENDGYHIWSVLSYILGDEVEDGFEVWSVRSIVKRKLTGGLYDFDFEKLVYSTDSGDTWETLDEALYENL